MKEDFQTDYLVGNDDVDDQSKWQWPDDPKAFDGMLKQPTKAETQMAHQEMDRGPGVEDPDDYGHKHRYVEGEPVVQFQISMFWNAEHLESVDGQFAQKPLGVFTAIGKFAFILEHRNSFLEEQTEKAMFLCEKGRLAHTGVKLVFQRMLEEFANTDIQQHKNGRYRLEGKNGKVCNISKRIKKRKMWQTDGAGGAWLPRPRRFTSLEDYPKLVWSDMTSAEKTATMRRFRSCINRHYGVVGFNRSPGRAGQHNFSRADVMKSSKDQESFLVVKGFELVWFVLQHGSCRHKDLSLFISRMGKEADERRQADLLAFEGKPQSEGYWKSRDRQSTPLLFPLPYNANPRRLPIGLPTGSRRGGGVGK